MPSILAVVEGPMKVALVALLSLVVSLVTGATAAARPTITVFGAADLAFALRDISPRFEATHRVKVTLVMGSTGNLAHQVAAGAPADVLFAANEAFVDDLIERGALLRETRALYAQGRIGIAARPGRGLKQLGALTGPGIRRIAIANPGHAPYGKAAEEALRGAGLWETVKPRLVYGDNVRHTLQFLETGAVDVAIIALSIAEVPGIEFTLIDAALHLPLNQAAAVTARSAHPDLAQAFIRFVLGPEGRPIMKRYGFLLPGEF
jgi:molybdate transport system substrate-binding protein